MAESLDLHILETSHESFLLSQIEITDRELKDFLFMHEPELMEELVSKAVKIGLTVLKGLQGYGDFNIVEKGFNQFEQRIEDKVNDLEELMDHTIENFSTTLKKVVDDSDLAKKLDPKHKESLYAEIDNTLKDPKSQLMSSLNEFTRQQRQDQIDFLTKVASQLAIEEEIEKSTQKGFDYEDEVYSALLQNAKFYGDTIQQIGNDTSGKSKKGDFLVEYNLPGNPRCVIEAKDHKKLSFKQLTTKYMPEALGNYQAEYGIVVAKQKGSFGKNRGSFIEVGNLILCVFDTEDLQALELAYRFTRMQIALKATNTQWDQTDFRKHVKKLREEMKTLSSIKGDLTSMEKTCQSVKTTIDSLRDSIMAQLDLIEDNLTT